MYIARRLIALLILPTCISAMHKTERMNQFGTVGPVTPTRLEQNRLNILQHTTPQPQAAASSTQPASHYTPLQTAWCQMVDIIKPEITDCLPMFRHLPELARKAASIPTSAETDFYFNAFKKALDNTPKTLIPQQCKSVEERCKLAIFCLEQAPGVSQEITSDHLALLLHRIQSGNDEKIEQTVSEIIQEHCIPTEGNDYTTLMQWYAQAKKNNPSPAELEQLYFRALTQKVNIDDEICYSNPTLGIALLLMHAHTDTASSSAIVKKMYHLYE